MNVDCLSFTTFPKILLILLAKSFAVILYRHPISDIGLYPPNSCGFSFFGISVKNEALIWPFRQSSMAMEFMYGSSDAAFDHIPAKLDKVEIESIQ